MSQAITISATPGNFMQTLHYSQGDVGRDFTINIDPDFTVPSGATVEIVATKPSGFGFTVAGTVTDNSIAFTTTEAMTDEWGTFAAELKITHNSDVIGTANFWMKGEQNPHPDDTVDGQQGTIVPQLTLLVERVETAASNILDMTVNATTLAAGSDATYSYDSDTNTATFGIPRGADGSLASGVLASTYSSSATYAVGDYVYYSGDLYRCTTAITTAEAWTSGHWTEVALADEVSDVKDDLGLTDLSSNMVSGGYIATNGATVNTSSVTTAIGWHYAVVDCTEGDCFIISATSGSTPRAWCFIDTDGNSLAVAPDGTIAVNDLIVAPKNATKLVANFSYAGTRRLAKGVTLPAYIEKTDADISDIKEAFVISEEDTLFSWESGLFNVNSGATATSSITIRTKGYVPDGLYSVSGGSTHNVGLCAWDENNSWIGYWDGTSAFAKSFVVFNEINLASIAKAFPTYKLKLVMREYSNASIAASDGTYLIVHELINPSEIESIRSSNTINLLPEYSTSKITRANVEIYAVDGAIHLNGTSNGTMVVQLPTPKKWEVGKEMNLYLSKEINSYLYIRIMDGDDLIVNTQNATTFTLQQEPSSPKVELYMRVGGTLDNVTVKPSISETYCSEHVDGKLDKLLPTEFPAMLTIIDDDGNPKFYTDILPIIRSKHVSIASAFYNSGAGTEYCMTWEQLTECYESGAEILSHTYDHQTSYPDSETEEEIEWNYTRSKNGLIARGFFGGKYLVYSGATADNLKARKAAKMVYDLALTGGNVTNFPENLDKHFLKRYAVETSPWLFDEDALKGLIDDCLNTGGWMVWMIHTSAEIWSSSTANALSNAIDYARAQGLPIVSVDHVYNKYLKNM